MSDYIFWESTQKARREHFCDWCCNYIEPGMIYRRHIWVPRKGSFHVMREHETPCCPPNIGEQMALEMMQEERIALGVPIAFVVQIKEVLLVQIDGSTVSRSESEVVPVIGHAIAMAEEDGHDDDVEIPF